jgi:hypothetical protein
MDYLEFTARVTSHIPDKGQVMVRYYGLYANAHLGKVRKANPVAPVMMEDEPRRLPSKGWAERGHVPNSLEFGKCPLEMRCVRLGPNAPGPCAVRKRKFLSKPGYAGGWTQWTPRPLTVIHGQSIASSTTEVCGVLYTAV